MKTPLKLAIGGALTLVSTAALADMTKGKNHARLVCGDRPSTTHMTSLYNADKSAKTEAELVQWANNTCGAGNWSIYRDRPDLRATTKRTYKRAQ